MVVDSRKIKKRYVDGKLSIGGAIVNPDKMRVEWNPEDLTENVFGVLSVIRKSFGGSFKYVGDIHKLPGKSEKYAWSYEYNG